MHQSVGSNLFSLPFLSVCIRESSEPNMLSDLLALASLAVIIVIIVLVVVNKFRRQRTARRRLLLANRTLDELETAMNGPGFQDEMDFERYKELILFTRQLCLTISDSIKPGQKINWPSVFLDTGRLHGRLDVCETETRAWLKRIAEAKKDSPAMAVNLDERLEKLLAQNDREYFPAFMVRLLDQAESWRKAARTYGTTKPMSWILHHTSLRAGLMCCNEVEKILTAG